MATQFVISEALLLRISDALASAGLKDDLPLAKYDRPYGSTLKEIQKIMAIRDTCNFNIIIAKYMPYTNRLPARIKLTAPRFNKSVYISELNNYASNHVCSIAIEYLTANGFEIVGQAQGEVGFVIITNTFKSL